jgi:spore germination protein GerM
MSKTLKYLAYILACVAVFLFIAKYFNQNPTKQADAFEWQKSVAVYFPNVQMGSDKDCTKVFSVSRTIINAETLGPGALQALLDGVSETEKAEGYYSGLNKGIIVQKFEIKNGIAYVDLDQTFNKGIKGACKVQMIKAQIETTLNNQPDIDSVVLSVNGKTDGVLKP